jgi:hypothetical protein
VALPVVGVPALEVAKVAQEPQAEPAGLVLPAVRRAVRAREPRVAAPPVVPVAVLRVVRAPELRVVRVALPVVRAGLVLPAVRALELPAERELRVAVPPVVRVAVLQVVQARELRAVRVVPRGAARPVAGVLVLEVAQVAQEPQAEQVGLVLREVQRVVRAPELRVVLEPPAVATRTENDIADPRALRGWLSMCFSPCVLANVI